MTDAYGSAAASHTVTAFAEVAVLVEQRHAEPGRARRRRRARATSVPVIILNSDVLPLPLRPDDAPAIALPDRERHVVKERRRAEFDGDVGKRELGHSRKIAGGHEHVEC